MNQSNQSTELPLFSAFMKLIGATLLFFYLFVIVSMIFGSVFVANRTNTLLQKAHVFFPELVQTVKTGLQQEPKQQDGKINFFLLGGDQLPNRPQSEVLTDTMILVSVDLSSAKISLFSLPRDIWIPKYQVKLNKLYAMGQTKNPTAPASLLIEQIQQMTGVTIHHTIFTTLDTVGELVTVLGGVDINIPESFSDPLFPRENVDVTTVRDPKILYETVSFASGSAHLDAKQTLQYIRSRHAQGDQGNDGARSSRQQQVMLAIIDTVKQPSFWKNLDRDAELYAFYMTHFASQLSVTEAIAVAAKLLPNISSLHFVQTVPTIYPFDQTGVIYHPETSAAPYRGAWVYEVRDAKSFAQFAQQALGYEIKVLQ